MKNLLLISLVIAMVSVRVSGQVSVPSVPKLSAETKKALDKGSRNALKHCEADPSADQSRVADSCLDLAIALGEQAKDESDARVVLERSCDLGSWGGCDQLGHDLDFSGDHRKALEIWQNSICGVQETCKISLLNSVARTTPVDKALLRQVGESLCKGGNDSVCVFLAKRGIRLDYAEIINRNRTNKVNSLMHTIEQSDREAVSSDQSANEAQRSQNSNPPATGLLGGLATIGQSSLIASMKIHANSERRKASSARTELQALQSTPIQIPQVTDDSESLSPGSRNGGSSYGGSCPASLSYLSTSIPSCTPGSETERLREMALATDVSDLVRKVHAQGMTVAHAVDLANQQADAAHAQLPAIEEGIRQASNKGSERVRELQSHSWGVCGRTDDALTSLVDTWITITIQEITNREVAKQMNICAANVP